MSSIFDIAFSHTGEETNTETGQYLPTWHIFRAVLRPGLRGEHDNTYGTVLFIYITCNIFNFLKKMVLQKCLFI